MRLFNRAANSNGTPSSDEVIELTNQFYVTLRASFASVKQNGHVATEAAFDRVEQLLDPEKTPQNWTNAYEIEQLLVHLFDDDMVTTELNARILEAHSILRAELAAMYDAQYRDLQKLADGTAAAETLAAVARRRRLLLGRMVNDLQWRYIVNEATRRYSKAITRITAILSLAALLAFLFVIGYWSIARNFQYGDLHLVWIAGLAGTWGATFSMLATAKNRLAEAKFDDLKLMRAFAVLVSRAAIGAGAACILFFFLSSGLLGGTAFPALTDAGAGAATTTAPSTTGSPARAVPQSPGTPDVTGGHAATTGAVLLASLTGATAAAANATQGIAFTTQPAVSAADSVDTRTLLAVTPTLSARDLALLIVWCFIAGFSEQLIPGLLASTEARAGGVSGTDRFRPTAGTNIPPVAPPTPSLRAESTPAVPPPTPNGSEKTPEPNTTG